VGELADRLAQVGERGVVRARLLERRRLRVPRAGERLERRDVDVAVVQVALDERHVPRDERSVGVDRAAGEDARLRPAVLLDGREDVALGALERDRRRAHAVEQAVVGVHLPHERVHALEHLGRLPDHALDLRERREVRAG